MKVAFLAPLPFPLAFGGLEVQILRTAEALRPLGVDVELLDPWKLSLDADLLHCFGSEYQLGEAVEHARDKNIPVVVSSVFLPKKPLPFYRVWKHVDRLVPMKTSFGVRRDILRCADAIIALTKREAHDIADLFGAPRDRIHVISNGVDERFFSARPGEFQARYGCRRFVLCVASVESRKNQERLIRALDGTGLSLVLIGRARAPAGPYERSVVDAVRERSEVLWIDGLPHDSPLLASAYAAAAVYALPSLTEGQPLSVLEAAAAGANLVISDLPYLRDAFGDYAWYCDPRWVRSIRRALLDAAEAPRGRRYSRRPPWLLSWSDVALRLRDVYQAVLTGRSVATPQPGLAGG